VTSTSLRLNFGDMKVAFCANAAGLFRALPGQSSTTSGWSAPADDEATYDQVTKETVDA